MATATVDAWIDALGDKPAWQSIPWPELRNRPLTRRERAVVREYYGARYVEKSDYSARHPWHAAIARFRITVARQVFGDLGKTLDAGCSAGETVAAGVRSGVDCWGFDVCPDLAEMAYPEVRDRVRMGRFDHIPYSADDGFETLISYDVFEHVPLDELEQLPNEMLRLGIRRMACVISVDTGTEEHITIQDTDYYVDLFGRAGYALRTDLNDWLEGLMVPGGWNEASQRVLWGLYPQTGSPRNGWNQVPGHLFFERKA